VQFTIVVAKKLSMLAGMVVMPGGLLVLAAILLVVLFARSDRGQRVLYTVKRRIPPRLRVHIKRAMVLLTGENQFLPPPPSVRST